MADRVKIGDAVLYHGDCLEILPTLTKVDAVITDPPYGVGFVGKETKHIRNLHGATYEDTEDYFRSVVLEAVRAALSVSERAAIFCGVRRLTEYPTPADIGGLICPNGGGMSPWGFGCYNPVLFYGKSPFLSAGLGSRPTASVMYHPGMHVTGERIGNDHPCPKPIAFMEWALNIASLSDETILDPFMGSGTTGVACANLGRKFIGIEIERKYFDIACERIEAAYSQGQLFEAPAPTPPEQRTML